MSFLFEDIIHPLGLTLLDSLWQGALILLVCGGLLWLLRHKASRIRYYVVLVGLFALPIMAILTFSSHYQLTGLGTSLGENLVYTLPANIETVDTPILAPGIMDQWHLWAKANANYICLFWVLGFVLFTLRLTGGFYMVHKLKKGAESLIDEHWAAQLSEMSEKLKVKVQVSLLQSVKVTSPIVLGYLKPVIIFPMGLIEGLPTDQIEAILLHELAHIKRFDYLLNILVSGLQLFFFYHPAYWWLQSQLDSEREYSCDDLVLTQTGDSLSLIKALTAVREFQVTGYSPSMAFAGQKNQLLKRVERIMKKKTTTNWLGGLISMSVLLLSFFLMSYQSKEVKEKNKDTENKTTDSTQVVKTSFNIPSLIETDSISLTKFANHANETLARNDSASIGEFQMISTSLQESGVPTLEQATLDLINKYKSGVIVKTRYDGEIISITKQGKEVTGKAREVYERAYAGLMRFTEDEKSSVFDEFHAEREASLKKQLTKQLINLEQKLAKTDTLTYRPDNIKVLMSNIENLRTELRRFEKGQYNDIKKQSSYRNLINSLLYEMEKANLLYEKTNRAVLSEKMEERILRNLQELKGQDREAIRKRLQLIEVLRQAQDQKNTNQELQTSEIMKLRRVLLLKEHQLRVNKLKLRLDVLSQNDGVKAEQYKKVLEQYYKALEDQSQVLVAMDDMNAAASDASEEVKQKWVESIRKFEKRLHRLTQYEAELVALQQSMNGNNSLEELFTQRMLENLESDGLLEKGWSSLELSSSKLAINGKNQPKKTLKKYLKLYKDVTGESLSKSKSIKLRQ